MSSEFGSLLKISVFGQSHGRAIGVVVDGLPAGEAIDLEELNAFLARRKPGKSHLSTARREADAPVFLSGLENGVTCGAPLCAVIENGDQHSSDYDALQDKPRPGHADYTAFVKWGGQADMRGGGHFSGRLTAPLCIAGGIAKQILSRRGVYVGAHLQSVGTVADALFPLRPTKELFDAVAAKPFPVLDDQAGERMQALILEARKNLDSVGGVVECAATGLPAGLGEPMFGGVENRLAAAVRQAGAAGQLLELLKTKRYATARLRRFALDAALGVPAGLPALPYLHVLGAGEAGLAVLQQAKQTASLPLSASLAVLEKASPPAAQVAALHAAAEDFAALCLASPRPMGTAYTQKFIAPPKG